MSVKFHADHNFRIGRRHVNLGDPCQDFATSEDINDGDSAIIVVSDGCSSGIQTDVGSRIISLATKQALSNEHDISGGEIPSVDWLSHLNMQRQSAMDDTYNRLGLTDNDMLATCAFAYLTPQGGLIHYEGDGAIALTFRDGRTDVHILDWAVNTPYYPVYSYIYPYTRLENFKAHHVNGLAERIQRDGENAEPIFRQQIWQSTPENPEFTLIESIPLDVEGGINGVTIRIPEDVVQNKLQSVALFSDGIVQFTDMGEKSLINWQECIPVLMKKRGMNSGDVTNRRMNILFNQFEKIRKSRPVGAKGIVPMDDISFALIHIEPDKEVLYGDN
jgi:hypothetical protein